MRRALGYAAALLGLGACARASAPSPRLTDVQGLAVAESLFADLRALRDRWEVSTAAGLPATPEGRGLDQVAREHDRLQVEVSTRLTAIDSSTLGPEDARALGAMRRALGSDLAPIGDPGPDPQTAALECAYDPAALAHGAGGLEQLRARVYACYGRAQSRIVVEGDTLDRLTILGALGRTDDPARRERLFRALAPIWYSVNRSNEPGSPYRRLIALEVAGREGREPSSAAQVRAAGVPPDSLEPWLLAILAAWRDAMPHAAVEPWDWYYEMGRASRALSPRIPPGRLAALNAEVYRALGADVGALGIRYDLAPRDGKTPVAFCTFGRRARRLGGRWIAAEPWVFATYRTGGLDNLNELLHETGHAVHIAAIRSRPAFTDWPDSDPFTEAVAEFVSLDVYEPAWQQRWLGDSVPLAVGLRARYAGIVMDVAWALFELRMQRDPAADPNAVWTTLTSEYLRIRPHPELSWWAMRGQLVDAPGYMMNYAAGAMLIAALRARTVELHGPFAAGDPGWYAWITPRLFRFGLERPTRRVVEEFLGGPVTPAALLSDLQRLRPPA